MTPRHPRHELDEAPSGTHVFVPGTERTTHVCEPTTVAASHPTRGYTLAGSPDGEPPGRRGASCT
jgi:hypothetical protein